MRIALVQYTPSDDLPASVDRGLLAVENAADEGADMVIFPELAFTPFYPQHHADPDVLSLAEGIPGPTTELFQDAARQLGVVVVINLFERSGEHTYDASPVIDADGTLVGVTRMSHIADYENFHEKEYYEPGDSGATVYQTAVGRIGVAICYDRHYPEYLRALALAGAELVVVPQAGTVGEWPEGIFEAEMQAASFQNGYFTALVNRVGQEGALDFAGGSFVTDPLGRVVAQAPVGEEVVLYVDVDLAECAEAPAKKLFLPDRRPEIYGEGVVAAATRSGMP